MIAASPVDAKLFGISEETLAGPKELVEDQLGKAFDTLDHSTRCTHIQRTFSISLSSNLLRSAHSDDIDRMQAMVSVVTCSLDEPSNGTATSKHEKTRIRAHASSSLFFDTLDHSTKSTYTQRTSLISFGSAPLRSGHNDDIGGMQDMACSLDAACTVQQEMDYTNGCPPSNQINISTRYKYRGSTA